MGSARSNLRERMELSKLAQEYHFELSDLMKQKKMMEKNLNSKWVKREQLKQSLTIITSEEMVDSLARLLSGKKGKKVDKVTVTQYIVGMTKFCHGNPAKRFELSFKLFDTDSGGDLDKEELEVVLDKLLAEKSNGKKMNRRQRKILCKKYFAQMDSDGDGSIDMEEFRKVVARDRRLSHAIMNLAKFVKFDKRTPKDRGKAKLKAAMNAKKAVGKLQAMSKETKKKKKLLSNRSGGQKSARLKSQMSMYSIAAAKRQADRLKRRSERRKAHY